MSEPDRVEAWLRLLSKKRGTPESKRRWLEDNLDLIEAEADASFPDAEPTQRALNGKIRALIIRWYNRASADLRAQPPEHNPNPVYGETKEERIALLEARDEEARRLHPPGEPNPDLKSDPTFPKLISEELMQRLREKSE